MSQRLPEFIEPLRLVEARRSLEGQLTLAGFPRLADSLKRTDGYVEVAMDFRRDGEGSPCIMGKVRAELVLVCQRCLGDMRLPLNLDLRLGLVPTDARAKQLPVDLDPLVVSESPMSLSDIIEDELVLALPIIPMHPPEMCEGIQKSGLGQALADTDQLRNDNPFAVLESLKNTKRD